MYCREEARWRTLSSENISYKALLRNVNGRGKMIIDPHSDPEQHQNLTTSRGSPLAHVYRVW